MRARPQTHTHTQRATWQCPTLARPAHAASKHKTSWHVVSCYMRICAYAWCIHITLHDITWQCSALHSIASHCVALYCLALTLFGASVNVDLDLAPALNHNALHRCALYNYMSYICMYVHCLLCSTSATIAAACTCVYPRLL